MKERLHLVRVETKPGVIQTPEAIHRRVSLQLWGMSETPGAQPVASAVHLLTMEAASALIQRLQESLDQVAKMQPPPGLKQ